MHLFIDTNIFLAFYHLTSDDLEELRKLALLIDGEQVVLLLPDQVAAEFRRNRENKIADALKGLKEQRLNLQFPQICKDYPEYPDLRALQKQYEERHSALLDKVSHDISNSTLKADETIKELFAKAKRIESTPELVSRAKLRIAVGHPPGKDNSIGDAINWEALLDYMPPLTDLHFITDDRDYVSILDENRFKDFLFQEWAARTQDSKLHLYRRLSSFFKDYFPQIKLASELERELLIQKLASSPSFSRTHSAVARLSKHTQFTAAQRNDIVRAAVSNNQVSWIIDDDDVHQFLTAVTTGHEDEIEDALLSELQELFAKWKVEEVSANDQEDIPF